MKKEKVIAYTILLLSLFFLIFSLITGNLIVGLCGFVLAMKASTYPEFKFKSKK